MNSSQQHIIQKATLNLSCPTTEKLQQARLHLSEVLEKRVLPALSPLFDAQSGAREFVTIDHLEIDLGSIEPNISQEQLTEKLLHEIKKELHKQTNSASAEKSAQVVPLKTHKQNVLLHFLREGVLPPFVEAPNLDEDLLILLREQPDRLLLALRKAIAEAGLAVIKRLVRQFSGDILRRLFELKPLDDILQNLEEKTRVGSDESKRDFCEQALQIYFSQKKDLDLAILQEEIFTKKQNEKEGEFLCKDVGIILLHPFLKSLFSECGLVEENGKFKNEKCAEKAVGLLHFSATGETQGKEYNLALQKIMCGLPLNYPINATFKITEEEKAECEKVLNAVIHHWKGIGSMSILGLRDGFLQREGKIRITQDALHLKVERKTLDILLSKLVWNITMVHLPWLGKLLHVKW